MYSKIITEKCTPLIEYLKKVLRIGIFYVSKYLSIDYE